MALPQRRSALVTGAGRGIGRAIAEALAPDHDLILVGRDRPRLEALGQTLSEAHGHPITCIDADLAKERGCTAVLEAMGDRTPPVQILINNAGIAHSAPLAATDDASWNHSLAVNLTAPFRLARALVPAMMAAGWGRIINVASTAALKGYRYTSAYSASKAGLAGLTRALAVELAAKHITVNAVCPGFTDTDVVRNAVATIQSVTGRTEAEARRELETFSPLRRLLHPAEVAALVAYLCSDDASAINGQTIAIDGGETA